MEQYQIHKAVLEADHEYSVELINLKVGLDELDTNGHTALHWAVFRGDVEIVKLLLEAGADPNIFSSDGVTPKWRAQDFGLEEIFNLLEKFGGKVLTNHNFDATSFTVFSNIIGQPLPENEIENEEDKNATIADRKKWWKFW